MNFLVVASLSWRWAGLLVVVLLALVGVGLYRWRHPGRELVSEYEDPPIWLQVLHWLFEFWPL